MLRTFRINGLHRRKAVVRDWFGNGETVTLKGKMEVIQQSEYDVANAEVTFDGLQDVNTYNIHQVSQPTMFDNDFKITVCTVQ